MSRRMGHRSHHQRPAALKRSIPSSTTPTKGSAAKSSIWTIAEQEQEHEHERGQPQMAASFLQFCATCEKQIFTPSNSILYCSEACRRKDSCKPLSLSAGAMTPSTTTPPTSAPSSPRPRPILTARIPTGSSYPSATSFAPRIPTDHHNAKSDLDPTEWKPKLHCRGVSSNTYPNSEAFRYLCRFHQSTTTNGDGDERAIERIQRPTLNNQHRSTRSNSSLNGTIGTPSLAQTPNTTASSSLSTSVDYTTTTTTTTLDYDFNTRPLPPRHDPSYSSSAGATKGGYELVMPHVVPPAVPVIAGSAPDHIHFHGGVWEKRTIWKVPASLAGGTNEGLGALFGGAEMEKGGEKWK